MSAILLLGLVLRLIYLDLMPLASAQVQVLAAARQTAQLHPPLQLAGVQGHPGPALVAYLLALPAALSPDPRLAAGLLALVNILALAIAYVLLRTTLGPRETVMGLSLLCLSPWAIVAARSIGPESLLLPLALLYVSFLLRATSGRRPGDWLGVGLLLGAMAATSLATVLYAGSLIVLLLVVRRRVRWAHLVLGLGIGSLLLWPFALAQNAQCWSALPALLPPTGATVRPSFIWAAIWQAQSGRALLSLVAPSLGDFSLGGRLATIAWAGVAGALAAGLLSALAVVIAGWGRWRDRQEIGAPATLLACLVILVLLVLLRGAAVGADFMALILAPALLASGVGLARIVTALERLRDRSGLLPWHVLVLGAQAAFVVLLVWQSAATILFYDYAGDHDTSSGIGIPYRHWKRTATLVTRAAQDEGLDPIWVIDDGPPEGAAERLHTLAFLVGEHPRLISTADPRGQALVLPAESRMAYLVVGDQSPTLPALAYLGDEQRGKVLFPNPALNVTLRVVESWPAQELLATIPVRKDQPLVSGLQLVGWSLPEMGVPGIPTSLITYWTFQHIPAESLSQEHVLYLVLARDGVVLSGTWLSFSLPPSAWQSGLLVRQTNPLALPTGLAPGPVDLVLQVYRLGEPPVAVGDTVPLGQMDVLPRD